MFLEILLCIFEAITEIVVVLGVVIIPFIIIGMIIKGIEFLIHRYNNGKYYKSDTKRAKAHRKVYNFLIDRGYDSNVAYRTATKITHWE